MHFLQVSADTMSTVDTVVPRSALTWVIKGEASLPLSTTHRLNTPDVAEQFLG
jgi:hypothetical protein